MIKAKGFAESGNLGETFLLEDEFCAEADMRRRWNPNKGMAGGGLVDNGSHSADIFSYLVVPVHSSHAICGKRSQEIEPEDTCHLHFRDANGVVGSVDLSSSIHKESPFFLSLYRTEWILEIGRKGSHYRQSESWTGLILAKAMTSSRQWESSRQMSSRL
jgi:predicted dehydrogenase